jgi:AraC family transcriptional regulator of adaptative response/methylated-DNA-[protein]-cysteine methyltransferase
MSDRSRVESAATVQNLFRLSGREMRAAVASRDERYDDRFVYGVVTTGVFCRPSCPSRRARPENLRFFPDGDAARSAGFRPCRRCRPEASVPEPLIALARRLRERPDETLTESELAARVGLSPAGFRRAFKRAFGVSARTFRDAARRGRLKEALRAGGRVIDAVFEAGYGSSSRVYEQAGRQLGMSPGAYRRGGEGETIVYAIRDTGVGRLLMAATARGVCAVQFGDADDDLVEGLRGEFPAARLLPSPARQSPALDAWMEALKSHLDEGAPRPDLPLDLRGTAFQLSVWRFLLGTAEGEVISYGELATGIDRPRAVRAAASACGANRIGVLVPCHRVLRGDGGLGGYRWGLARKRALLDTERKRRAGGGGDPEKSPRR